jgi:hypothetical protein
MSEALTERDQILLARAAECVHRMTAEADRANRERAGFQEADDPTLRAILSDRNRPALSRMNALMLLIQRGRKGRDGSLAEILIPLWDDPDENLVRMAIESAPAGDPEVRAGLHALLDGPRSDQWSNAASVLARRGDATIIPRLTGWFRDGDEAHRNVAWSCLCFDGLLGPDDRRALLREAWDAGGRDDSDRAMLAVGLLNLGDRTGWDFLVDFARRADDYAAVWAAETVMEHDPALGLDLMLQILDHGATFQVRWGMVERIARAAGLPHVWTADGLAEARQWVVQQQERVASGDAVPSLKAPPPRMAGGGG